MELSVVAEKCLDRLIDYIFFVTPMSVCTDHLTELSTVVSQVIDSDYIVPQSIVNLID